MKALLLYRDHDFDLQQPLPWNAEALIQDLELHTLFGAMALGDKFLADVAQRAVLSSLRTDLDTIRYRQDILKDCLNNAAIVRNIYDIAVRAIDGEKKVYLGFYISKYPSTMLSRSVEVLQMFVSMLKQLRRVADEHAHTFNSDGFTAFFEMLRNELSDAYFARLQNHLRQLQFRDGMLISAELGEGNKGANYMLRKPPEKQQHWLDQIFAKGPPIYTLYIADRDEAGARALSELKDRGLNLVANALAQSTDHILNFFTMLRTELAFYIACLNLHEQLAKLDEPVCFPQPAASGERRLCFQGLYDVCLALTIKQRVVGNDVQADKKEVVIITGANQG
ncbi:MAG TPA: DNA mismatch repair protein MutS, partial [Blastocatellia bacterium]|nr:DNA mismatch repair protein MutS [Blastocatellia bacterium]